MPLHLITISWQRKKLLFLSCQESLCPRIITSLHTSAVVFLKKLGNCLVQLYNRMEHTITQRCINSFVAFVDRIFHECLVLWFPDPCRQGTATIMSCQIIQSIS